MADYTQTYINGDMSKFNTVLQTLVTNNIVGAVDYDSSGTYAVFTIYADAEKTTEIFRITQSAGQSTCVTYTFKATASDGGTLDTTAVVVTTDATKVNGYTIKYGYSCANGIMISICATSVNTGDGDAPFMWLLISKNQNGEPVFVWINNTGYTTNKSDSNAITSAMTYEYVVAASDVSPLSRASKTGPAARNQTVLSPFFTCCPEGSTSYTPDAGRFTACSVGTFIHDLTAHEITFDGAKWLTNGYWALKVGSAA